MLVDPVGGTVGPAYGLLEDALDHDRPLAGTGAEVPAGGFHRGVPEQGLYLRHIGAALAQPGGVGVPQPVRPQPLDAGLAADRQHHRGQARDRQRPALAQPQRAGLPAARQQPPRDPLAAARRQ